MQRVFYRYGLWVLLLVMGVTGVMAQDTPSADEVVRAALRQLAAVDYRFSVTSEMIQEYRTPESTTRVMQRHTLTGESAQNGDYAVNAVLTSVPQEPEQPEQFEVTMRLSWIEADGVAYINVETPELFDGMLDIAEGWARYEMLLSTSQKTLATVYLQSLTETLSAPHHSFAKLIVMDITEQTTESLEGVPMRVYTFTVSPLSMIGQSAAQMNVMNSVQMLFEALRVVSEGEFSDVYRMWVGEADGLPYRIEYNNRNFIPWLSRELGSTPFDFYSESQGVLTFEYPDTPLEIRAPSDVP